MNLPKNADFLQRENAFFFQNLLVSWEQAVNGLNSFFFYIT
jgi:hypothetical protein